jgi:hypothetical protein
MNIPLIICIRNTVDWENIEFDQMRFPLSIPPNKSMNDIKKNWSLISGNDICKVRAKIKHIAMENWCKIPEITMIVDASNIKISELVIALSIFDNYFLLPTDDDDWYHPDIYKILEPHANEKIIRWQSFIYRMNPNHGNQIANSKIHSISIEKTPQSNTWAFTKSGIESILNEKDKEFVCRNHQRFEKTIEKYSITPKFIQGVNSIYNSHLASASILITTNSYRISKRPPITMPAFPEHSEWCKPYIQKLNDLFESLSQIKLL